MDLVACSICSGASLGDLGGVGGGLVVGDDGSHRECSSMSVVCPSVLCTYYRSIIFPVYT
jgi:hypothetical protein